LAGFLLKGQNGPVIRAVPAVVTGADDPTGVAQTGTTPKQDKDFSRRIFMAGKRLTKAQVIAEISNGTELDKKSVSKVFEALTEIIRKQLTGRGPGEFVVPGLVKLRVVKKPATKERQGINPFTKEPITIPAKPASKKVRATALKNLKDLVQ
jgi:nucleoid DNA-binding protein